MKKHLSVLALAARGAVCKVILITLAAAVIAGALLYLVPAHEEGVYKETDGEVSVTYYPSAFYRLPSHTGAAAACAAGFAAVLTVLSLNGCGYGAKTALTVRRLRIGENRFSLWWTLHNAACILFYWAVMAAVLTAALHLRIAGTVVPLSDYTSGPQTLLLAVYTGSFLHHLMPLRDVTVWVENLLLTALCAAAATRFSHAQRRGSFSAAPLIALALTVGSFFLPLGSSTTILVCLAAAAALGFTVMLLLKGETEHDGKPDFRVPQDA